jgi:arylsulfatase A-like enzyme
VKRRDLIRAGAVLPAAAATGMMSEAEAKKKGKKRKGKNKGGRSFAGKNVILFITDQQRAIQHFPENWAAENLPGATRLAQNGLSFNRAFCSACMCSPSRATLMTGHFPAQHGVKYTLEEDMTGPEFPYQVELPLNLPNIATVMKAAGYRVPYKGKWHLSKTIGGEWIPEVVNQYGFEGWDPPDAGANQDVDQFGGGKPNNDGRFMNGELADPPQDGVLQFLQSDEAREDKFFLVVSLVNPHDVLAYPNTYDSPEGGYTDADLVGDIGLPETVDERLNTKPTVQQEFLAISSTGLGLLDTPEKKKNYLNFYGNLMKESDAYLVQILETLDAEGLTDDTVIIQTSDHGEMGLAHGGLRQKNFNFYEETLRVPLVFSNPKLFPNPRSTNAMVSHVDFLPTIASLFGAPKSARAAWQGVDYSSVVRKPKKKKAVQSYVVFTYDDFQSGQPTGPYPKPPNHIASIREGRLKLARYYDADEVFPDQWEMYDLKNDPLEQRNIAAPSFPRNKKQNERLNRMKKKLAQVEATRLQPLSS